MRYSGVLLAAAATIHQTQWLAIFSSTPSSLVLLHSGDFLLLRGGGEKEFMGLEMLLQCRVGRGPLAVLAPLSPSPPLFVCLYAQWCSNHTASLPFSAFLHPDPVPLCGTTS